MEITYFTQSPTSKGVPLVSWILAASVLVACNRAEISSFNNQCFVR